MLQTTQELCSEEEVLCQIMWKCLQKLEKSVYMNVTVFTHWDRWTNSYSKQQDKIEDKTSKLTNKNEDAVDDAIVPKMMRSMAPSTEQYLDMDCGQKKIIII